MPSRNVPTSMKPATSFVQVIQKLGLSPRQYGASAELKEWARQNKDEKYIPPKLLDLWGFEVNVDIPQELLRNPPTRAA